MLFWVIVFFVVAIVAALFGFGGIAIAQGAVTLAQTLFFIFLVMFIVALIASFTRRPTV